MPVAEHLEVERKYDADPSARAPDWEGLDADEPVGSILRAVYFDTPGLRLLARGATLRWRSGEAEEGWHLKTPARAGRIELQALADGADPDRPADPARLPEAISLRLRAWTAGHALVPVARLVTLREETTIPEAGTFCDDLVTATRSSDGAAVVWREWEFELVGEPDPARVVRADERILRAGGRPASSASKLARALGHAPPPAARRSRGPQTVGAFLAQRLGAMRERLCAQDCPVRADEHDSVHQLRVTTRTLRSLLRAFGPVLRKSPTKRLSEELRWLAGELGAARDAEVRARRFESLADSKKPAELRAAAGTLAAEERAAYRIAHRDALRALDSRRYFRLLDALDAYVADPPVRGSATRTAASSALAAAVAGAASRLLASDAALTAAEERDEALHDVRKHAKGLRHVGELAHEAGAGPFAWAGPVKQLQELLGDHHDAVVLRDWLRERARRGGSDGLLRGVDRLIADERARARKGETGYAEAFGALRAAWEADRQRP